MGSRARTALRFIAILVAVLLYGVALHWVYVEFIYPEFLYRGYGYRTPEALASLIAWLAASIAALALPRRIKQPSSIAVVILYFVVIAPAVLMSPYFDRLDENEAIKLSVGVSAVFVVVVAGVRRKQMPAAFDLGVKPSIWAALLVLVSSITYLYLALTAGISFQFLAILEVYEVRAEYSAALAGAPLLGYLVGAQSNAINPIVIAVGISQRRWSLVALGIAGQLVLYSVTGFKTILFSIAALLLVAMLFRRHGGPTTSVFLWGATAMVIATAAADALQNQVFWSSFLVRRFLYTPARLTHIYYEFYDERPKEMLAHSILAPWISSPYEFGPSRTISSFVYGEPISSMNANLFADGFAHFGWFGMLGAAVILICYLRIVDRVATGLPLILPSLLMVVPAVTLSNSSILTSMLTHGLVAVLVLIALAPRPLDGDQPSWSRGGQVGFTATGPARAWRPRT